MTPLRLAMLVLLVVTAAAAVALAKKDRCHRPVAWFLVGLATLDLARLGLSRLLPATSAPREGSALIVRHAEAAAYLGAIMLLPAMTMALFLRRRPWAIGALYLAIWVVLTASYPAIRGHELMLIYTFIELAGVVASVGFFIMWLRSPRVLEDSRSVPIMSGLALIGASLAIVVLPQLTGPETMAKWPIVVATNALALAFVLVFQLRHLFAGKREL